MKKLVSLFLSLVMLVSLFAGFDTTAAAADTQALWVDPVSGSDTASGTQAAPFRTIEKAKTAAAALSETGDVTVWLHDGTYTLGQAITFTAADSGKNGHTITYKAVSGEVPVISGGTAITGWKMYDAQKNIYAADVPSAAINSRQFYVDGEHQTRAMTEQSPTDWTLFGAKGYMSPVVKDQNAAEYLILDLGESRSVNYLTIYTAMQTDKNGRAAGFPQDFTIETSTDGAVWTVRHTETGFAAPVPGTSETFRFEAVQARFVKLNVTRLGTASKTNPGRYMLALSELETGLSSGEDTDLSEIEIDYSQNLMDKIEVLGHNENHNWNWLDEDDYHRENLFDGNLSTVVTTGGYYRQWIEKDGVYPWLSTNVSKNGQSVKVAAVYVAVDTFDQPVDFTIEISQSDDPGNTEWTVVHSETGFDWSESRAAVFVFSPLEAKKVRLHATKIANGVEGSKDSSDGKEYALHIAEFAAYAPKEGGSSGSEEIDYSQNLLHKGCVEGIFHNNPDKQSYYDDFPLDNLVDGDDTPENFITSKSYQPEWLLGNSGTLSPWVEVRLTDNGAPVKLGAVRVAVRPRVVPNDFEIQVSVDGETWKTVVDEDNFDWSAEKTSNLFTFQPVQAVKLRLIAHNLKKLVEDEAYYFQLTEMEAYAVSGNAASGSAPDGRVIYVKTGGTAAYTPAAIEALHDNTDRTYAAEQAINGMRYENLDRWAYSVPESFGLNTFKNTDDLEINIQRWWYHRIIRSSGVSADGTAVYLDSDWLTFYQDSSFADRITWLENAYEFIDQPGEWYIDREESKIYYKPNGTMSGKSAIVPVTEQLLVFEGCENITFDGVLFENTSWLTPNEIGYTDAQSGTFVQHNGVWGDVAGAIETHAAKNITITNSELRNLGGGGIRIGNGSTDCSITNNAIHDISSSGIWIGNNTGHNHGSCEPGTDVTGIVVRNNYVTRTGLDIFDASAICALYTSDTVIDHNEVCNTSYTGISLGWGWDWKNAPCTGNNTVSNNYIHDTGKTIHDGGSFYSLGLQEGTKVFGNYVHHHSDGLYDKDGGLYTDEGSTGMELYDNVVGDGVYWWQNIWTSNIKNCYWHDNFYSVNRARNNGTNIRVENNTYVEGGEFSKYPAAQAIIDNAGLTDQNVKAGVRTGVADKHNVTLVKYPDCEAYYFAKPAGLLTFTIPGQIGNTQYNKLEHTASILMPEGSALTALAGQYTAAAGFTCDKASGSVQDFSAPVTYTFTDGTDSIVWTITVKCDVTSGGPLTGTETKLDKAIANRGSWTQEPSATENGGSLFTSAKGFSTYIGDRIADDAILEFDMQSELYPDQDDWTGYALRMQDPYAMLGTMYHVVFKNNSVELQKWVNGQRTMLIGTIEGYTPVFGDLENEFYTSNVRHSIKTGAVDVPTGVRLFLYVDGNKVFDVIDADDPITNDGFFGIYPMTHDMTLLPFTNIDTSPKPDPDPDPEPEPEPEPDPDPILPFLPGIISAGKWKNPYLDVSPADPYYDGIRYVTEQKLMNGTGNDRFSPSANMTRAMMVTILWRMENEPAAAKSAFTDLTASWYRSAIDWASETGVVNGIGNGKFAPDTALTLEQLLTILYRYAAGKGYNAAGAADLTAFADAASVSAYAKPAMQWAAAMGFVSGERLNPRFPAARAQIAQILMLFCKAYVK